MTTANCPRCSEQVSVPDDASREATVRCPFCRDEYSLGEALDQLPPTLIVVSDYGGTPAPVETDEKVSPWAGLNLDDDDADEVALAPLDSATAAPAFDFAGNSATATSKPTTAVRPSSRARKPKASPIKSVLSIVIGGLMAFPIAQLILWYLPGDWKRDFGAGPIVAQYFEAIVPVKFRGKPADTDANSQPARQDSGSIIPDFNFDGGEFAKAVNDGSGTASSSDEQVDRQRQGRNKKIDSASGSDTRSGEEQMSLDSAAADGTDVFEAPLEVPGLDVGELSLVEPPVDPAELPSAITAVTEEPAADVSSPGDSVTSEPVEPTNSRLATGNIRHAPQVSADDVAQSLQAALQGSLAWDEDETGAPSSALKHAFYASCSKLGEVITFADRSDESVAAQISETAKLLQDIGKSSDKLAAIEAAGGVWIKWDQEKRKTNGVCLSGRVESVRSIGKLFETIVESGGQQIAVVSTSDPSEFFAPDRQVLILGTILEDPGKNLGGYEGSRAVVVLDGFHVNVSAE